MSTITLPDGTVIWYHRQGVGAPLLQIHGSAFGHKNFEKMTPLMAEHFEVIDFDLPGYGESRGGPAKPDMASLGDLVYEVIKALGLTRVNVHGTSFGAMIGVMLAARHPEVIDRLILSCFLAKYDGAARMMRGTWKRAARDSGMEAVADLTSVAGFARSFYDRPEAPAQLETMRQAFSKTTPEAMIAGTEAIERTDLTEWIPKITAPTLLLAGREDNMTPLTPSASGVGFTQFEPMLEAHETVIIPDCGHYLVIEQPEVATQHIVDFLKRNLL